VKPSDPVRTYRDLKPGELYPFAKDLFYECMICGEVIPSMPYDAVDCACHNIWIDAPQGRMGVNDPSKLRLFRVSKS
jgi:hypothetical protein